MARTATRRALVSRQAAGGAWSPLDLASLAAWYDFSDADTLFTDAGSTNVTTDGDLIYQANDKSGNDYHVVQATKGSRPVYKTAVQNALSVCRFVSSDVLLTADTLGTAFFGTATGTIVIVQLQTGADERNTSFSWAQSQATDNKVSIHASYDNVIYFDFGNLSAGGRISVAQPSGWDNSYRILAFWRAGTGANQAKIYDGGTELISGQMTDTLDNTLSRKLTIGGSYGTSNDFLTGDICEVIVCTAALSVSDLNALGGYLADKWSITWADVS